MPTAVCARERKARCLRRGVCNCDGLLPLLLLVRELSAAAGGGGAVPEDPERTRFMKSVDGDAMCVLLLDEGRGSAVLSE